MKYWLMYLLSFSCFAQFIFNNHERVFYLEERVCTLSSRYAMKVYSEASERQVQQEGYFEADTEPFHDTLFLYDKKDHLIAQSAFDATSIGSVKMVIQTPRDHVLVRVKKSIEANRQSSIGSPDYIPKKRRQHTSYFEFYSSDGSTLLGYSTKVEGYNTRFEFRDTENQLLATAEKTFKSKLGLSMCSNPTWVIRKTNLGMKTSNIIANSNILSFVVANKALHDLRKVSGINTYRRLSLFADSVWYYIFGPSVF